MKLIWYHIVKIYISTGLNFFYKRIVVRGQENIPRKGGILFVSNHKNALIDPLLIATHNPRNLHFLTRASAFKIGFVKWLLSTVNMLPIYRMRDGKSSLAKNEEVFQQCFQILNNKRSLLIFPEGTHDLRRLVRPLSKGFTRITFGVLEKHPDLDLHIVPVGLNYSNATNFAESVSIIYGPPIHVNPYFEPENLNVSTVQLKNVVSEAMKELTVHITPEHYDETLLKLGQVDFLSPEFINNKLKQGSLPVQPFPTREPNVLFSILKAIVALNSFIPLLIYKKLKPIIKEDEFISTTKFAVGMTAFPLFYLLQSMLIAYVFGMQIGMIYLVVSFALVFICAKIK